MISSCAPKKLFNSLTKKFLIKKICFKFLFPSIFLVNFCFLKPRKPSTLLFKAVAGFRGPKLPNKTGTTLGVPGTTKIKGVRSESQFPPLHKAHPNQPTNPLRRLEAQRDRDLRGRTPWGPRQSRADFSFRTWQVVKAMTKKGATVVADPLLVV